MTYYASPPPPVVHDWVIKGLGMSSRVCATGHIKDPGFLLVSFIKESSSPDWISYMAYVLTLIDRWIALDADTWQGIKPPMHSHSNPYDASNTYRMPTNTYITTIHSKYWGHGKGLGLFGSLPGGASKILTEAFDMFRHWRLLEFCPSASRLRSVSSAQPPTLSSLKWGQHCDRDTTASSSRVRHRRR